MTSNTPWIVVYSSPSTHFRCQRCELTYVPNLPCPLSAFAALARDFISFHRGCREKKEGGAE